MIEIHVLVLWVIIAAAALFGFLLRGLFSR